MGIDLRQAFNSLGVLGATVLGGTLSVAGVVTLSNTTATTAPGNGALALAGGLGVAKEIRAGQQVVAPNLYTYATNGSHVSLDGVLNPVGAQIAFFGPGPTTPSKYIRALGGQLEFVNSAYNAVPAYLTDIGTWAFGGDLIAFGSARRFYADLTNATNSSRFLFTTTAANSTATVGVIPSGTGVRAQWQAYNLSNPTNAGVVILGVSNTEAFLASTATGSGTHVPLSFYTNNVKRAEFGVSGIFTSYNDLVVTKTFATLVLNTPTVSNRDILFQTNSLNRWRITSWDGAEDFFISSFNDLGAFVTNPLHIARATGQVTIASLAATGTLTGTATKVQPVADATNANQLVTFVAANGAGQDLRTVAGFTFNPSTLRLALNGSSITWDAFLTSSQGSTGGYIGLHTGSSTNTGYLGLWNAAGVRRGYIGFADGDGIAYHTDSAGVHNFYQEIRTLTSYGLRLKPHNTTADYGFIHYADANNYYVLLTNSGDSKGGFNSMRPFLINGGGNVSIATVGGSLHTLGNISSQLNINASGAFFNVVGTPVRMSGVAGAFNGNASQLEIMSTGTGGSATAATVSFHRPASFAMQMGLDVDNNFKWGGWSVGVNTFWAAIKNDGTVAANNYLFAGLGELRFGIAGGWNDTLRASIGSNATYTFFVNKYNASGVFESSDLLINRTTGHATFRNVVNVYSLFLQGDGVNSYIRNDAAGGSLYLGTNGTNRWQINDSGQIIGFQANAGLELGSYGVANTPYIDFHSGTTAANDYDSRIYASGGSTTSGQGTLGFYALYSQFVGAGTSQIQVVDTGPNGANLKLTAAGGSNPSKTIRSLGGNLQFINNAYTQVIFDIQDSGAFTATGAFTGSVIGASSLNVLKSGDTMTGTLTLAGTGPQMYIRGAAGTNRYMEFHTGSLARWALGAGATAESGSNVGTSFFINRYNDSGVYIDTPLQINRATGVLNLFAITVQSTVTISGAAGTDRGVLLQTAGVQRWGIIAQATAESGSNAGSDLWIYRLSDAGAYIDAPLVISRATGAVNIGAGGMGTTGPLTTTNVLTVSGAANLNASATSPLFISTSADGLRIKPNSGSTSYALIFRNDGANFYLLKTALNDANGTWTSHRPFTIDMATGNLNLAGTGGTGHTLGNTSADLTLNGASSYVVAVTSLSVSAPVATFSISGGPSIFTGRTGVYASNLYQIEAKDQTGSGGAFIGFHRPGFYGILLGLDNDNSFKLGSYSWGAGISRFIADSSGNFLIHWRLHIGGGEIGFADNGSAGTGTVRRMSIGSDATYHMYVNSFDAAGTYQSTPFLIRKSDTAYIMNGGPILNNNLLLQGDGSNAFIRTQNAGNLYLGANGANFWQINPGGTLMSTVATVGIEMGALGVSNAPYIDFHTSTTNNDYDVRIQASGGSTSSGFGAFSIIANGGITLNGYTMMDASAGNSTVAAFRNTGSNGVQIGLQGNGAVTPNKTIRLIGGTMDIVNSAYTSAIWTLYDSGNMHNIGTLLTSGGLIEMNNGGANLLLFGAAGVAAPSFTTRSAGTRISFYPGISGVATEYAMGMAGSTLWLSVPGASQYISFYSDISLSFQHEISLTRFIHPSASKTVAIERPAGQYGILEWRTGTLPRWRIYTDNPAESGGDVGSNLGFGSAHDDGSNYMMVMELMRREGAIKISNAAIIPSTTFGNGGILYAEGGALKWRGGSGTITTLGPA